MTTWELYCAVWLDGEITVLGPKCHTANCAEVATARVHWPTGPIEVCEDCAERRRLIAERGLAMHLYVEAVRFKPVGPRAPDDTEQRMRLLELT